MFWFGVTLESNSTSASAVHGFGLQFPKNTFHFLPGI